MAQRQFRGRRATGNGIVGLPRCPPENRMGGSRPEKEVTTMTPIISKSIAGATRPCERQPKRTRRRARFQPVLDRFLGTGDAELAAYVKRLPRDHKRCPTAGKLWIAE
jgi:hypothetical protein